MVALRVLQEVSASLSAYAAACVDGGHPRDEVNATGVSDGVSHDGASHDRHVPEVRRYDQEYGLDPYWRLQVNEECMEEEVTCPDPRISAPLAPWV